MSILLKFIWKVRLLGKLYANLCILEPQHLCGVIPMLFICAYLYLCKRNVNNCVSKSYEKVWERNHCLNSISLSKQLLHFSLQHNPLKLIHNALGRFLSPSTTHSYFRYPYLALFSLPGTLFSLCATPVLGPSGCLTHLFPFIRTGFASLLFWHLFTLGCTM